MGTRGFHLLLLLFLSGAGALVLETAWFRRTAQIAGGTSVAMAAVLAAVIGGMAAGALLFGRTADRVRRPIRLYALLEAGIAAAALFTPVLLDASEGLFDLLFRWCGDRPALLVAAQFLLSALLLAGPAILMGGTLPAMAAAIRAPPEERGRALGRLYAANTLGAVAGTLAAGFLLLPALGLTGAVRSAAIPSGVAALLAFALSARRPAAGSVPRAAEPDEGAAPPPPARAVRRAILLYAASGFLGLAAEVAFVRQLVLVFGSTTYAFTTMLAVFLFGIGLGGAIGARLAARPGDRLARLETTVAATAALFSLAALGVYVLPRLYLEAIVLAGEGFEAGVAIRFLLSAIVLLPGAIGLGIAFPLAAHLASAGAVGAGTGRLYAANTAASIAGSSAAVFLLIPALGPRATVAATAVVVAAVAAAGRRRLAFLGLVLAAAGLIPPSAVARERLLSGVFFHTSVYLDADGVDERAWAQGADLPWHAYGRESTVAVMGWYGRYGVLIDGKAVATDQALADEHHLSLLGHLPMAIHPDPRRVLVVGLGMGTTWRACREHEPESLTVVELEEAVLGAAEWIGGAPADVTIGDARTFLRATDRTFDVITSDPIHPWVRGGGDLYTIEYFESVRARLAPGGVACQWLPVHQMAVESVKDVLRTFAVAFPAAAAYYGGGDLVLIGMEGDSTPSPRPLTGQALASLSTIGIEDLGALNIAERDRILDAAGPGPLLRDDSLVLEFAAPRAVDNHELDEALEFVQSMWVAPPAPHDSLLQASIHMARGERALLWRALATARRDAPRHRLVERTISEQYLIEAEGDVLDGDLEAAETSLARARERLPDDPRILGIEAELREAQGRTEEARAIYDRLIADLPRSPYLRRRRASLP